MSLVTVWPAERAVSRSGRLALVSSVSSDAHTWNLVFLQLLLEEMGCDVINIGACVPDDLLIEQCRRHHPDLVVISSVNGHGHLDGRRLITRLRAQADLRAVPVIIGGKLGTRGEQAGRYGPGLLAAGFTAVFEESVGVLEFRDYFRNSLAASAPAVLA